MIRYLSICLAVVVGFAAGDATAHEIRVLMMTGQNNHKWEETTPVMSKLIKEAGHFELEVSEKPWDFGPDAFDECDVVLSNWSVWPKVESDPWSDETKQAFLKFIEGGGGLVVVHAGSSVHYTWDDFQALVGKTWKKGTTWHGPKHSFKVTPSADHPITRGIARFEIFDELWRDMAPTGEYETLATADTAADKRKQGPQEPMLMITKRGKGRGVNLVLGHDTKSMANDSFQKIFLRSLEWAATGDVASEPIEAAAAE